MLKRIACVALVAAAFQAPPAQAGLYLSGSDLYADCSVPKDNPVYFSRTERCTGFITGVVDAIEGLRSLRDKPYCIPADVTLGQLNELIRRYLDTHADDRRLAASALVMNALEENYKCSQ